MNNKYPAGCKAVTNKQTAALSAGIHLSCCCIWLLICGGIELLLQHMFHQWLTPTCVIWRRDIPKTVCSFVVSGTGCSAKRANGNSSSVLRWCKHFEECVHPSEPFLNEIVLFASDIGRVQLLVSCSWIFISTESTYWKLILSENWESGIFSLKQISFKWLEWMGYASC